MSERTTKETDGYARVFFRNNGGFLDLAAQHHVPCLAAFKSGHAFYDGSDVWLDPITIKLSEVHAIAKGTPDGIERWEVDEKIEREREKSRDITGE